MPALPVPGSATDANVWGAELNTWLTTGHRVDGTHPPRNIVPAPITANYSVVAADQQKMLMVDASGVPAGITITLPDATTLDPNWEVFIIRINGGANLVTVATVGGQLINDFTTWPLDTKYAGITPIAVPTGVPIHWLLGR